MNDAKCKELLLATYAGGAPGPNHNFRGLWAAQFQGTLGSTADFEDLEARLVTHRGTTDWHKSNFQLKLPELS